MHSPSEFTEIAAVDLGSNSFRLQFAKVVDGHLIFHDSLREQVKLGAGLNADKTLSEDAQQRAIACLERFSERLRGLPVTAVRAVATNTFRVAKNANKFLPRAEKALGFPIEVIGGREEARMIFLGVSHSLQPAPHKRLVVDIGGGSTEFIVGQSLQPHEMESLFMGCVSYTLRFFSEQKLDEKYFTKAQLAAATELQNIAHHFAAPAWQEAIGSSGTARTLGEVLRLYELTDGTITLDGLKALRQMLIKCKHINKIDLLGVSADRASVLPGGLAIMLAIFESLKIERMRVSDSALREGVLYELLGRMHDEDTRELTVNSFMRRYHVDRQQAKRVRLLSKNLLSQVKDELLMESAEAKNYLAWAAKLHEIGISIAHTGYHKHSAYIVENADMPGFSRLEQEQLGILIRTHRRALNKIEQSKLTGDMQILVMVMRIAVLFNRNRQEVDLPKIQLKKSAQGYRLNVPNSWLEKNPLTQAELDNEIEFWRDVNVTLNVFLFKTPYFSNCFSIGISYFIIWDCHCYSPSSIELHQFRHS